MTGWTAVTVKNYLDDTGMDRETLDKLMFETGLLATQQGVAPPPVFITVDQNGVEVIVMESEFLDAIRHYNASMN
jgi:hypothetical protein